MVEPYSARMVWRESMTFDGTTSTGHALVVDSAKAHGGQDLGPRPMELLLAGLAGCTAMDVLSILQKKQEPVQGLEVEVQGVRAEEHPRYFTDLTVLYRVRGKVNPVAVARAIELSETKYCGARYMLGQAARITSRFEILDGA